MMILIIIKFEFFFSKIDFKYLFNFLFRKFYIFVIQHLLFFIIWLIYQNLKFNFENAMLWLYVFNDLINPEFFFSLLEIFHCITKKFDSFYSKNLFCFE